MKLHMCIFGIRRPNTAILQCGTKQLHESTCGFGFYSYIDRIYARRTYQPKKKTALNRKSVALRVMCARLFVMLMNLKQSSHSTVARCSHRCYERNFIWNGWWVMASSPPPPSLKIVTFSLFTLLRLHCGSAGNKPNLYTTTKPWLVLVYQWMFFFFEFFLVCSRSRRNHDFLLFSHRRQLKYMRSRDAKQNTYYLSLLLMGILKFIIFICVVVVFVDVYLEWDKPQAVICDVGFFSCFCFFVFASWTHWL